jgi:hypothetical protein
MKRFVFFVLVSYIMLCMILIFRWCMRVGGTISRNLQNFLIR